MICVAYVYIVQKVQINTPFMHLPILIRVMKGAPPGPHVETLVSDKIPNKITTGSSLNIMFVYYVCVFAYATSDTLNI